MLTVPGTVIVLVAATVVTMLPGAATAGPGSAQSPFSSVSSDQQQVAQLEQRIAQDGETVQKLVFSYNQAQANDASIEAGLAAVRAHLVVDQREEARAKATLRQIAIESYLSDDNENESLAAFETSSGTSLAAQREYSQIASSRLHDAIDTVANDEQQTQVAEETLRSLEVKARASLAQLDSSREVAQTALNQDQTLLGQAQANLQTVLAAVASQLADEAQEEEELAQGVDPNPVSFALSPTPGAYVNPLRSIGDLYPERVDQGVDYSGYGPVYAIGNGVVLSTTNSGWPGGTFIAYRLSDGPAGGLVVYAAEDIDPMVSVGQAVNSSTVLGTMYEGPDGIETGWADASGDGETMARDAGQFSGANSTAFGANFSQLLASVGAPPGVMQNEQATGVLPGNWPSW